MTMMAQMTDENSMSLQELLRGIAETNFNNPVSGVNLDSRLVKSGDLFLAIQGEQDDGARYIKDAIDAGAAAVAIDTVSSVEHNIRAGMVSIIPVKNLRSQAGKIIERFYHSPSSDLYIVGVTGTNGKTSVAYILAQALRAYEEKEVGFIGTLGYGSIGNLQESRNTTPDPVTIHQLLSDLRNNSVNSVVMEVSSHALQQGRVSGVDFNIGVFTNLSRDHLDYHSNIESYADAKRQLFLSENMKFAVINVDDEYGKKLQSELKNILPIVPYGIVEQFSEDVLKVQALICEEAIGRLVLDIRCPWGRGTLRSNLHGRFNVYNLLASLAVLCLLDVPFEQALEKLSSLDNTPGRLEYFGDENSPQIFVDYAHTPDALEQALLALREQQRGKLFCVFGCGGERDQGKRAEMGKVAEQYADKVIVTSDNPRAEIPERIIDDILAGVDKPEAIDVNIDRADAIRSTILSSKSSDIVLIAGKGHETYQEIAGKRIPFSDRQLVRNVLGKRA